MKYLLFVLSLLLFSSCAQLSSFQTGKTLGKGTNQITVTATGYGVTGEPGSIIEGDLAIFPFIEVMGQFGITDRLDLGLKLSTGGNAQGHAKFQFAGSLESKFAAALGGGLSYQWADEVRVYRAHVPLYLSYHPGEKDAIYATPRYIYQSVSDDSDAYFLGSSLGYSRQLSQNFTLFLEGNISKPFVENDMNETLLYQFGVGGGWRF